MRSNNLYIGPYPYPLRKCIPPFAQEHTYKQSKKPPFPRKGGQLHTFIPHHTPFLYIIIISASKAPHNPLTACYSRASPPPC